MVALQHMSDWWSVAATCMADHTKKAHDSLKVVRTESLLRHWHHLQEGGMCCCAGMTQHLSCKRVV